MRKTFFFLGLVLSLAALADNEPLAGFLYSNESAPTGDEWQSPEKLSLNKEQPRAYLFSFSDVKEALQVLPQGSAYYQSLDGIWKFHWVASPDERPKTFFELSFDVSAWDNIRVPGCWNVQGLQRDGSMKYGVPVYVNQPVIFYHEIKEGDWKEGVMRKPKDDRWTTYKYPNEVGSYRRSFTIPTSWKGRHIYINFDGVDSFFYLWINGHYVGFSKNSRNTARFDITRYLQPGQNVLAVEVYRNSDGSFLEAQDMFRLPGIFRSTYLTAMPEVQIQDLAVRTQQLQGTDATISVDATIRDLGQRKTDYHLTYQIFPVVLYGDDTQTQIAETETKNDHTEISLQGIRSWNAETPYRYVLVASLHDQKGKLLDCTSTYFGICKVEIRDTPASEDEFGLAGRYFYVNGKPVKLKGVNRHETNPSLGHAITHDQMRREVFLMKQGNINHVRTSHYSNDPYWFYLCDKYGIYLEDECNIESHEYYYGKESLSHPKEWKAAHVARNMEMVHSHVNHPSIVIWSLGNEAGPGDNFVAAYKAIKEFDARPVQYERNNEIVDMGSNQYPSVSWVQQVVKGGSNVKYPFHISEYAHSMGNSLGNLVDYWQAIESTNFLCGGAIWDWVDQAIDTYTADGTKYLGYGGDHGDWPNDGMFCMNGIMLPDLSPKPQYFEVKKVYQNVGVTLASISEKGDRSILSFHIFNKNYFQPIDNVNYKIMAQVVRDGEIVSEKEISVTEPIQARQRARFVCPMDTTIPGEYFLNVQFLLRHDMPWGKAGYVQMEEQLPVCNTTQYSTLEGNGKSLQIVREGTEIDVQGDNFHVCFDDSNGYISSLSYDDRQIITPGNGPKIDALRAPVDNDNWVRNLWYQNGLHNLQHKTTGNPLITKHSDGSISLSYNIISQGEYVGTLKHRPGKAGEPYEAIQQGRRMTNEDFHFITSILYTVYPDGTIDMESSILSSDPALSLPRLGYVLKLPRQYEQYTYYGRGPLNNYADRKTGSFVGLYKSTVHDQFVNFPKPQSMGNHEEVRWCALTDSTGMGLQFISGSTMSTSALPWSALQMTLAQHPYQLPQSDGNYLHLDCQVLGLGGNSCGQGGPLEPDCVKGALHQMSLIIRPVHKNCNLQSQANVRSSQSCPVVIIRDRAGKVSICGDEHSKTGIAASKPVYYSMTKQPAKKGTLWDGNPIDLRQGGTLTAWYEGMQDQAISVTYDRIEDVPLQITYVSSEEGPGGDVAQNLVDGDPNTIWHTMYSITVPKYPHWIDFDCGETKTIKGFSYLPRQDGSPNGNIRSYKVELSQDGKSWSRPIAEGEFVNDLKEKKVTFPKPQKARYLRFTALSSQNGADFASGAEFSVLAE